MDVYDKLPQPPSLLSPAQNLLTADANAANLPPLSSWRSYDLVLGERALSTLRACGVVFQPSEAAEWRGGFSHKPAGKGPRDATFRGPPGSGVVVNRGAVAMVLVRECKKAHPDTVK